MTDPPTSPRCPRCGLGYSDALREHAAGLHDPPPMTDPQPAREALKQVGWFIVGPDGIAASNFRMTYPKWGRAVPAFVRAADLYAEPTEAE